MTSGSDTLEYVRSRLWIAPLAGVIGSLVAALGALYLDRRLDLVVLGPIITDDADSARAVLTVVASAMIALTVFTFSMTMLIIQLASNQYSPRILRSIVRDRATKGILTLFLATFVYSLVALRGVVGEGTARVPELSLAATYLLSSAALLGFVMYMDHVAQSIRVGNLIGRLGREASRLIDDLGRAAKGQRACRRPPLRGGHLVLCGDSGGVVRHIDEEKMVAAAEQSEIVVEVLNRVGDFVPAGSPLLRVHGGEPDEALERRLRSHVSLASERTMQQDIAYALRQLVDIGIRALSPGVNDPTTAVQAIDQIHDLLRRLAPMAPLPEVLADRAGEPRVVIRRMGWDDHVTLATTELRIFGAGSPQITPRLRSMLLDLRRVARPSGRGILDHELRQRAGEGEEGAASALQVDVEAPQEPTPPERHAVS